MNGIVAKKLVYAAADETFSELNGLPELALMGVQTPRPAGPWGRLTGKPQPDICLIAVLPEWPDFRGNRRPDHQAI